MKYFVIAGIAVRIGIDGQWHERGATHRSSAGCGSRVITTSRSSRTLPHMTFTGSVKIDLRVVKPTRSIKLNAADLAFDRVSLSGVAGAPKIAYDAKEETATLTFRRRHRRGPVTSSASTTAARSTSRRPACSRSTTIPPTARSARSSRSSKIPTRGASFPHGTSPTRRPPSRSQRRCLPTKWRCPTRRSRSTKSLSGGLEARDVSPPRRKCPRTCSSLVWEISNVSRAR